MNVQNQLINPQQSGGAPIYIEDLVQVQENAKALFLPMLARNAELNGFKYGYSTAVSTEFFTKPGAFITPPIYSNISTGNSVTTCDVSPFTVLLGDKVCYYPGGSIEVVSLLAATYSSIAVTVGAELKESRVFRNGQTHDVIVTNEVVLTPIFQGFGGNGWNPNSAIEGKFAVALVPAFHPENGQRITSNTYYRYHPNMDWDVQGLSSSIKEANKAVEQSDLIISSWLDLSNSGADSGSSLNSAKCRKEELSRLIRFRGQINLDGIATGGTKKVGQLPSGYTLQRQQQIACVLPTDSNKLLSAYLEVRTDGGVYVGANGAPGNGSMTVYLDSVVLDY